MSNLTWTCHACKSERPDKLIDTLSMKGHIGTVTYQSNKRFCADNMVCFALVCAQLVDERMSHRELNINSEL